MADTVRTRAQVLALLGDNTTGDISPQDHRDQVVSAQGVYAQLYITGGATGQTIGTAFATMDWGAAGGTDGLEDNANADKANDRITIGTNGAGVYQAQGCFSFSGTAATTFTIKLSVGGTENNACACKVKLDAAGATVNIGFVGLVTLADGDLVTVEVLADGAAKTFTPEECSLVLTRLA